MPVGRIVLSVDDVAANRYVVSRVLRLAGYTVMEAGSGAEALRQLREMSPKPDLVLLDVHLPDVDGFEVCRRIKSDPETAVIPVLQISAHYTATQEKIRGLSGGADGYLVSPVDPEELLANVGALIRIRELGQKEQRLRAVLETVQMGTWDWNLRTGEFRCSDAHVRLFGLDPANFDGDYETFRRQTHPDDLLTLESRIEEARQGDGIYQCEFRVHWPDGSVHWVESRGAFTYSELGIPIWMTGVSTDVSERRSAEQALQASDERLRTALAMVAHELRNPLAAIQNALYMLRQVGDDEESRSRAQAMAERQIAQQSRLIDDLMDVARLGRGKLTVQTERVDFGRLMTETVADFASQAEAAQVSLHCEVTSLNLIVEGEPARLVQVLSNLISNAIKFTPAGGSVRVSLAKDEEANLLLTVRDTGIGLEPDFLARAFESFAQRDSGSTRQSGGLGLGLGLAQGLVRLHHGEISIESPGAGGGCTVRVRLPLASSAADAGDTAQAMLDVRPGRRVLIIEDNADAADSLREILELEGHEVYLAYSGTSGVRLAVQHRPEIVISDLGLPGLDGFAVAQALRREPELRDVYLIAMSGYGGADDVEQCLASGFDHHFRKPVDALQLLAHLAAVR